MTAEEERGVRPLAGKPFADWVVPAALVTGPIVVALLLSGVLLLALGVDPLEYFATVLRRGLLSPIGLEASLTRMAPLLLLAASLIVAFQAGLWNLGGDAQFLLGAVSVAAAGPVLTAKLPIPAALSICLVLGACAGALWSVVPALLRAYHGVNEIITTLMMSFLGISLANVLVKLAVRDPTTTVPQTRTIPVDERLPRLFGTTVTSGLLIGLMALVILQFIMTRTTVGLRIRLIGANARAAIHAGLPVPRLTVLVFAASAGLAGLAGAVEILGVEGNVRADWNPAFNLSVIPLVFLARLNGLASIVFVFLFAVLSIGGESAARRTGIPNVFTLVIAATVLIVLALSQHLEARRRIGPGDDAS